MAEEYQLSLTAKEIEDRLKNAEPENIQIAIANYLAKHPAQNGKDGLTPHIGANGNWWIGDEDTGVSASGGGGASSGDCEAGVETLLDFTTTEGVTEFNVTIPDAETAAKLNEATEIRFMLYVPIDSADTTTTTAGKVTIGINRGWKCGMLTNIEIIPKPTETWKNYGIMFAVYDKPMVGGGLDGDMWLSASVRYTTIYKNGSPSGGTAYVQNQFSAVAGNHFYVTGTQNMAAGTRLIVGVRK